jgi:hypothetical protein
MLISGGAEMMRNRTFIVVSALATVAFVGVLAVGLATAPRPEAAALGRVIEGMARETFALDCDISNP